MPRIIVLPYKFGSGSARSLAEVLAEYRAKRVRPDGNYRPYRNHFIVNWGSNSVPSWFSWFSRLGINPDSHFLNHPDKVKVAANKLDAFRVMKESEVSIPEFTTSREEALAWVKEGTTVVVRHLLRGNSGRGIEIVEGSADATSIPSAPLYVKYIKKQDEFRVHVFKGEVIDVQQKKKRQEVPNEEVNYKVRNAQFGWVFCREGISPNAKVLEEAKKSVASLGLDMSGVDVLWNRNRQEAYVIECNTAVGLEGATLENYKNAILRWVNS